jgi:predicted nucleic acid-binding protein
VRIYLDVCCLNRPFDDQAQERIRLESEAVLAILRRVELQQWELVGGEAVEFETGRMPDLERRQRVWALAQLAGSRQGIDIHVQSRARVLAAAGLKPLDALHVACAEAASVDVFLTTDDRLLRTIHRTGVARMTVNNPLPWLHEVLA